MSIYDHAHHLHDLHDTEAILADYRHQEAEQARAEEIALFDPTPYRATTPAGVCVDTMSVDRRRTARQAEAITRGWHPLSIVFGANLPLHPDADRNAQRTDRGALDLRCGSCQFRQQVGGYPKCTRSRALMTGSAATDCRAWWPACRVYERTVS